MSKSDWIRDMGLVTLLSASLVSVACSQTPPQPGQKEFDAANSQINTFEQDVGFGNTPEAKTLAMRYASEIAKRDKDNFEGGKEAEDSVTTKGKWLTYCQIRPGDVTLLVHVPNLDGYEGKTRNALTEVAWETATDLTRNLKGRKLTVALRGNILFGAIASGNVGSKPAIETGESVEANKLYPYFQSGEAKR